MATTQKDSIVKVMIKNLCRSYGWSYGVIWSFDQPNSIFSTMQDAYFEEQIQGLINDLLLQSPMLGVGLIGQAAFTKKHLWMSSEDNYIRQHSSGSIWDMFQDDSKCYEQFSSGIKTIAAIPLEPQGVLQFGSTNKIVENTEFINQTKLMFNNVVNGNTPTASSSSPNVSFASMIPSQDSYLGSNDHYLINHTSLGSQSQSLFLDYNQFTSNLQPNTGSSLTFFKEPDQDMFDIPIDFGCMDELFQTGDFNVSQWYPQSPIQSNVTLNDQLSFSFNEKVNPLTISGIDVDLFGNTADLGDIVTPAMNNNRLGFDSFNLKTISESKSTQTIENDSANLPPKKGLFSNLGIKELFEGISGTSTSCIEDQLSSGSKRRKTENCSWEMGSLQPVENNLGQKSEPIFKSDTWLNDGYSMDGSSTVLQTKKQHESAKPAKKKAKPGTRPRPKDRQMILDRMAELRELIPNGEKMSIDCLLDKTIKHMLFLQSVAKHADRIKQVDEPKYNGVVHNNYSNDPNNNGVTYACELGNQTMTCPLIVEDLSTPGQMFIEMICEEHGFFLEIVDIIRGIGLTILKGVMETRDGKICARFIVEAEAKRQVTRHELFAALVELLQTMESNDNKNHHLDKHFMQTGNSLVNDFHHSGIQLPVSVPDTRYGILGRN